MEEQANNASEKIQSLREMIQNAEKTLQGAKAMLLQLEGKKKVGRKKKDNSGEGKIVEGTFDGQIMIGSDGKQYPVPANYASKSKLVEGDMLKLTITLDGFFIYKQIGPIERKVLIGIASLDANGNYFVASEGKAYKVLLASITYFKVEPGDEVTLVIPRDINSDWGAIENVLQKSKELTIKTDDFSEFNNSSSTKNFSPSTITSPDFQNQTEEKKSPQPISTSSIVDEWAPDIEELRKELSDNN